MKLRLYLGYVRVVGKEMREFDKVNPLTTRTSFSLVVCQPSDFVLPARYSLLLPIGDPGLTLSQRRG